MSKIITVFGATGNQGGSVVKAILADPTLSKEFKIRAITRDTSKPAAQELASKGVEVVSADLTSKSSITTALKDSHTVFLITNYWENADRDTEVSQGKNVTDVAKELGVQHLIFSSLLNVTEVTQGRLTNVPHFDGKADIEQYIRDSGVPATFYLPGYFMQNLGMLINPGKDGVLTWALPVGEASKFPLLDVTGDTGTFITSILHNRAALLEARVLGATAYYTPQQILDTITAVTGKETRFLQISSDVYKSFLPEFMAQEMLENNLFVEQPGYYNGADLVENHKTADLKGDLTTWEAFLTKTGLFAEKKV